MDKKTDKELQASLKGCPASGDKYAHYKSGDLYRVVGSAIAEATQEPLVLYRGKSGIPFARPLREWDEMVEHGGKKVQRFTFAGTDYRSDDPPEVLARLKIEVADVKAVQEQEIVILTDALNRLYLLEKQVAPLVSLEDVYEPAIAPATPYTTGEGT